MKRIAVAIALICAFVLPAAAQVTPGPQAIVHVIIDPSSVSGTPNQVTVTCNNTTTKLLDAGAATQFISYQVPPGATTTVWFNVAGVAAVAAPPSYGLTANQSQLWSPQTGYLPTSQINCITSAGTQAVTISYK